MTEMPPLPLTVFIRKDRMAGRITLRKAQALNALDPEMSRAIEAALIAWQSDSDIRLVIIDAEGERAFCAGGDIASIYHQAKAGDPDYATRFWRQEYGMNLRLSRYPKPVVALMQGFVLGGGVGLGCHVSHRILGETAQLAMPECGIGLVPDVGGSYLLAKAPGFIGDYIALTSGRMGVADALFAGFADCHVPMAQWPALVESLCDSGETNAIDTVKAPVGPAPLQEQMPQIERLFSAATAFDIFERLSADESHLARHCAKLMARHAPLSMECTLALIRAARSSDDGLAGALGREFRYTARAIEQGDFLEGIRAQIIDKDRNPRWRHVSLAQVQPQEIAAMLAPLGAQDLELGGLS